MTGSPSSSSAGAIKSRDGFDDKGGDDSITLVLDDKYQLTASRNKLAKSCFYFQRLLSGPYREAGQARVKIQSQGLFSFEAFELVVKYADENLFLRDTDNPNLYLDALELAVLWSYDELVDLIQAHLADCLSRDTADDIHMAANEYNLEELQQKCIEFERLLEQSKGMIRRKWGLCPLDGHANKNRHHYDSCWKWRQQTIDDEDWDA